MRENTLKAAQLLCRVATGEEYGDGTVIMDIGVGIAEPGYGDDETVWTFGNYNTPSTLRMDPNTREWSHERELTKAETMPTRLANGLAAIGVETLWYDEWTTCGECYRAFRTQPDSYSWTMFGEFTEEACEYTCRDCMQRDPESYLASYLNDPKRAVTWLGKGELREMGFEQWEPNDPQTYESGWHPGQTDDPEVVLATIQTARPDVDVVFLIDDVSQFDVAFSAWTRDKVADDD